MKNKLNRYQLQRHAHKLSEIGLRTYGRVGDELKQTTDSEKLQLIEAWIREYQKDFFNLIDVGPYEKFDSTW